MAGIATTERTRFVDVTTSIGVPQMFGGIANGQDPPYLVLTALDWTEHAAGATGTGVVITYQASPGQCDSNTYGRTGPKVYNSSSSASYVTNTSVFGTGDRNQATSHAANAYPMTQIDAADYRASATAGTRPGLAAAEPTHDTGLSNDRLLPDLPGLNATPDTVGGMTVAPAQTLDLMAQGMDSSGLWGPKAWTGSQQGESALNVSVGAVSVVGTTASLTQVLYLQEAGDPALISVNDIHQGQIGDCFLLSAIGELALWHLNAIKNMIRVNADGTETVTLYLADSGALPWFGTTSFRAVSVTVDNVFPSNVVNNGASQDVPNGQKEIWVQVLEKAVATLNGGYNAIANGGYSVVAMEELTGQAATWISTNSLTLQMLQSYMAAGDLIVMDTPSRGSLP